MNRYERQITLWGNENQSKIESTKLLVIGTGGLGVPVLQYLAAAGIGEIGIADQDTVELSNIHRQPLFDTDDTGRGKAQVAAEKIFLLNNKVQTKVYPFSIDNTNAFEVFEGYDLVIDASDNLPTRYLISDTCYLLNMPLVYGGVTAHEGQMSVFNFEGGPTYRCLFPEPTSPEFVSDCATTGIMGTVPGTIGMLMATEVLKIITGQGKPLSGKLLIWNAYTSEFSTFKFKKEESAIAAIPKSKQELKATDYPLFCGISIVKPIKPEELASLINEYQLLDIREKSELPEAISGAIRWPQSEIQLIKNKPELSSKVLVYCQTGNRSDSVRSFLEKQYPDTTFTTLEGGIKAWQLFQANQAYGHS